MNSQLELSNYPLWTALVTPFNKMDEVDYPVLETLVNEQINANNAILLLGSTGEGLALTLQEQKSIVEFVCSLKPSVPLMVAVGGVNLAQQVQWVEFCNSQPIDALLLASPLYAKPGLLGQTHWFDTLLNNTELPCMLYNVPSRSAVHIEPQTLLNLTHHPHLWALKVFGP